MISVHLSLKFFLILKSQRQLWLFSSNCCKVSLITLRALSGVSLFIIVSKWDLILSFPSEKSHVPHTIFKIFYFLLTDWKSPFYHLPSVHICLELSLDSLFLISMNLAL